MNWKLEIDKSEVLRFIGYRSQTIPCPLDDMLESAAAAVLATAIPRVVYRDFLLERPENKIKLEGTGIHLAGEAIAKLLAGCHRCVLLAVTLGDAVDKLVDRAQIMDMGQALILDACCSAAVESLCDQWQAGLTTSYAAQGLCLTRRFSPGYGDFPLQAQADLAQVLDTPRKIGLCLNEALILIPRKSVTAVLGVSHRRQEQEKPLCAEGQSADGCKDKGRGIACGK